MRPGPVRYHGAVIGRGPRFRLRPYAFVAATLLAVTAGLVALRAYLSLATVVLIYLLTVFLIASRWGRGPSIAGSVLSLVATNFFFTAPYHTFVVASPQDVLSLLVFLVVAETTSRLTLVRLRLQREAAEKEILRRSDELKSILLSAVSHDLRTPLSSIRMAATALLRPEGRWDDEARRELLETIDSEASRLSRLVGNLLDLSRIEAGVLRPVKEPQELQEVVARAVDAMHDRLRAHHVRVDVAADVPLVPMDLTQIENVLVNLLDNSSRNAPEGTEIRIVARREAAGVVIHVENDGPPIPLEMAEEIFRRFGSAERPRQGTGLGLAICKGLVEAHGGRIWVDHPGGQGARFAFWLPVPEILKAVGERPRTSAP